MLLYLRVFLVFLWLVVCSLALVATCLFRWGDPSLNHDFARWFAGGALRVLGLRIEVQGAEALEASQPCVYLANHQSSLDVLIFAAVTPRRSLVIGKRELLWIPFFGVAFLAGGNIAIQRRHRVKSIAGLTKAALAVREKKAGLWIFPEGTRNRTDEPLLPFKKGAFYMAFQAGLPLVPVVAERTRGIVDWKEGRFNREVIRVRVLPPVSVVGRTEAGVEELIGLTRGKMLEAFLSLSADRP